MANEIVEVKFLNGRNRHAIYRGYDGKILEWQDLLYLVKDERELPVKVKEQLMCDGTALFDSKEQAEEVLKAITLPFLGCKHG